MSEQTRALAVRRTWPLVGRDTELAALTGATRRPGGGRGAAGVVLCGAAGVGKTRLARETLRAAAARGMTTRWVTATASGAELPLGPFLSLLPVSGGDLAELVPHALHGLGAGPGGPRLVVGVDDAHLLDQLSVRLVCQLALHGDAALVLTVRAGEPTPAALRALWEQGPLSRLDVAPLTRDDVEELLAGVLGGPVDPEAAARLWALTRGNALYLRLLVEGELSAGRLTRTSGSWVWSGPAELGPGLIELVGQQIGELPKPIEDVLDVLALAEPLPATVLARLTGQPALDAAGSRGLVQTVPAGGRLEARLAHPLYGEVRRGRCGRLRARRLRGEIATALAGEADPADSDRLRRAVLALDSDLPADPALLTESTALALRLLDFRLSRRLAEAAVAAEGGFHAGLMLSCALTWSGRGAEAEAVLTELAEQAADEIDRMRVLLLRLGNRFFTLEQPAAAEAMLDRAFAAVSGPTRLTLHAWRAVFHGHLGRPTQAIEAARPVFAATEVDAPTLALAGWGALAGHAAGGRLAEVEAVASRLADLPNDLDTAQVRVAADVFCSRALWLAGEFDRADAVVQRYADPGRDRLGMGRLYGDVLVGELLRERGQVRAAAALFRRAAVGFGELDAGGWRYVTALGLTTALGMVGDTEAARRALTALDAARHPGFVCYQPELVLARAWVAAAEGIASEAIELAHESATAAAALHQPAFEVVALHTAVRFGDRSRADRLAELAGRVQGPRAPAAAAHAAALAAGDPAGLLAAAERFAAMGALLLAADAAAHAAAAHRRRDAHGTAQLAAARARGLAERCGNPRTPALHGLGAPSGLTEREREIAVLAAGGSTNKEIAVRLGVSTRTVEGHLYRASAKLGVTSRAQLAELLAAE